jgi:hypothetical protein
LYVYQAGYIPSSCENPQQNREIFFPNQRGGELAVEFPMYTIQAVPAAARGGMAASAV